MLVNTRKRSNSSAASYTCLRSLYAFFNSVSKRVISARAISCSLRRRSAGESCSSSKDCICLSRRSYSARRALRSFCVLRQRRLRFLLLVYNVCLSWLLRSSAAVIASCNFLFGSILPFLFVLIAPSVVVFGSAVRLPIPFCAKRTRFASNPASIAPACCSAAVLCPMLLVVSSTTPPETLGRWPLL